MPRPSRRDVRAQPQKKDHAWIAPRCELEKLRKLYIGQLEIIWLTTKTFRLVAESRKASIRKRTREAPKILPFLRGHPGLLLRCRGDVEPTTLRRISLARAISR